MDIDKLKKIIEALIFASDEPLTINQIKSIIDHTSTAQIKKAIDQLNHDYRQTNRVLKIIQIAGGYEIVTHESYSQWVKELFKRRSASRLSSAALETLSIIAFKQPISNNEISSIRGVISSGVLKTLLERKLITISGRGEGPGRPLLYKTTREFLRYFGINSIDELPKPREIEELLEEKDKFPVDHRTVFESASVDQDGNIVIKDTNENNQDNDDDNTSEKLTEK
ncbi:MAG: SMC-Scp complex subunit ScpB [bacterium]